MDPVHGVHGPGNQAVVVFALEYEQPLFMDHEQVNFRRFAPVGNVDVSEQRELSRDGLA